MISKLIRRDNVTIDLTGISIYDLKCNGITLEGFRDSNKNLKLNGFSSQRNSSYRYEYLVKTKNQKFIRGSLNHWYDINKKISNSTLNLKINPTLSLRYQKYPKIDNKSLDKKENFLPQFIYEEIGRKKVSKIIFSEFHKKIRNIIEKTTSSIKDCGSSLTFNDPSVSIQFIEYYWDVHVTNATQFIFENKDIFQSIFKHTENKMYPTWTEGSAVQGNAFTLMAQPNVGEKIKIYPKEENTLRLEVRIEKKRIANLKLSNVISPNHEENLNKLTDELLAGPITYFKNFLKETTTPLIPLSNTYEIIYRFLRCFPEFETSMEVIPLLVANGKIEFNNEHRNIIITLMKNGFLKRTMRSIYSIDDSLKKLLKSYMKFCDDN